MKTVTYHDPNDQSIKPAFVLSEQASKKKSGKPTFTILVCDVPANFVVTNVSIGKKAGQIED